jgi:WD40 repeat protein
MRILIIGVLWTCMLGAQGQRPPGAHFRQQYEGYVNAVAFSPDGKLVAGGGGPPGGKVVVWDTTQGKKLHTLSTKSEFISRIAFSPDGKTIAAGGEDHVVYLWDTKTGEEIRKLEGHNGFVLGVQFSADGKSLLTSEILGEIRIWDVASGDTRVPIKPAGKVNLFHSEWSKDGKFIVGGGTMKEIFFFDAVSGKAIGFFKGHTSHVTRVRFSPDKKTIATSSLDHTFRLWEITGDPATPPLGAKELHKVEVASDAKDLMFTPDGKHLVVGQGDGICTVWDASSCTKLSSFEAQDGDIRVIDISKDGKLLATGSSDKTLTVWDLNALPKKK